MLNPITNPDPLTTRVLADCGVKATDFKQTDEEFTASINTYLTSTREWVATYIKQKYENNPPGLDQIIVEIVCNIIRNKVIRQGDPISDDEDSTPNYVGRAVSADIQLRLKPYRQRQKVRIFGV